MALISSGFISGILKIYKRFSAPSHAEFEAAKVGQYGRITKREVGRNVKISK
jgi:hypothetical protein